MMRVFFDDRCLTLASDKDILPDESFGLVYEFSGRKELLRLTKFFEQSPNIKTMLVWHSNFRALRKSFRSCFRVIKAAGGVVQNGQGEILFIFRRGVWDLPKGKLDKFENYEKAALREVMEECGLHSLILGKRISTTYHTYRLKNKSILKKTVWFEMTLGQHENPKPQLEEEITELRWIAKNNLENVKSKCWASVNELVDQL